MNISVKRLLEKMDEELKQAKLSESPNHIRERVHAIKTLCELVLDEQVQQGNNLKVVTPPSITQSQTIGIQQQSKRMEIDEESNGDSLFDF